MKDFLILTSGLLILLLSGPTGCMSTVNSEAVFLLEQDSRRMTDTELIAYEQQLSDELVKLSRHGGNDVSVGVGIGSWGSGGGFGVSADRWLNGGAAESNLTMELRARRDAVRHEMRQRGLLPP